MIRQKPRVHLGRAMAALMLGLLLAGTAGAAAPLEPGPDWEPREVVEIQLRALQRNNEPRPNAGIEQVWAFAHPRNRVITGPLSRFTRMLRGPGYSVLVNHSYHEIREIRRSGESAAYAVRLLARDGGFFRFNWQLRIAELEAGPSWMTTRVTPGRITGEQLSAVIGP